MYNLYFWREDETSQLCSIHYTAVWINNSFHSNFLKAFWIDLVQNYQLTHAIVAYNASTELKLVHLYVLGGATLAGLPLLNPESS